MTTFDVNTAHNKVWLYYEVWHLWPDWLFDVLSGICEYMIHQIICETVVRIQFLLSFLRLINLEFFLSYKLKRNKFSHN
jgi:hypothetical protein